MFCFVAFEKSSNKQLRVYPYNALMLGDWQRAQGLARTFAQNLHSAGYPCLIERFDACPVGVLDFDSEA